jgi:nucleoside-diphosphate-sugar epimerase
MTSGARGRIGEITEFLPRLLRPRASFQDRPPFVFVTGGSGVLGRAMIPRLIALGRDVRAPTRSELDLIDPKAVSMAVDGASAIVHLATRIPPPARRRDPGAWAENDRLRAEASRVLVDAALERGVETYVQASIAFAQLPSALAAEAETARFADADRRGVVLRFGRLDGPDTEYAAPDPSSIATLHVDDAGRALVAALSVPSGAYVVCRDGEDVSNEPFKHVSGWQPTK